MPRLCWNEKDKVGLLAREIIIGGQEPKTKGMPVWADSKCTWEKLQLGMQLVKGVNGFIFRVHAGGQIQFGVRVLPDQLSEMRARMLPNDVRYTNENRHIQELQQWRFEPLPYNAEIPLEWSRKAGVPWIVVPKAPHTKTEEQTWTFLVCCCRGIVSQQGETERVDEA